MFSLLKFLRTYSTRKGGSQIFAPKHSTYLRNDKGRHIFTLKGSRNGNGSSSNSSNQDNQQEQKKGFMLGDATFEPIDLESSGGLGGTSDEVFGQLALLTIGFSFQELNHIQQIMTELQAEMVKVVPFSKNYLDITLQDSIEKGQTFGEINQGEVVVTQKKILLFSGMYGAELNDIIYTYEEHDMPRAIYAAAVPQNYKTQMQDLIQELYKDDNETRQMILNRG